ncbi:hypothetical protein QFZ78_007315 [Paenibacillus sp. V4I5]|nr:hypothetical protein [Paenibacillus sp. V4I5]
MIGRLRSAADPIEKQMHHFLDQCVYIPMYSGILLHGVCLVRRRSPIMRWHNIIIFRYTRVIQSSWS